MVCIVHWNMLSSSVLIRMFATLLDHKLTRLEQDHRDPSTIYDWLDSRLISWRPTAGSHCYMSSWLNWQYHAHKKASYSFSPHIPVLTFFSLSLHLILRVGNMSVLLRAEHSAITFFLISRSTMNLLHFATFHSKEKFFWLRQCSKPPCLQNPGEKKKKEERKKTSSIYMWV